MVGEPVQRVREADLGPGHAATGLRWVLEVELGAPGAAAVSGRDHAAGTSRPGPADRDPLDPADQREPHLQVGEAAAAVGGLDHTVARDSVALERADEVEALD